MNINKSNQLIDRLKDKVLNISDWKFTATSLAIQLNNENSSPLFNYVLRPNETVSEERKKGREWIPLRQGTVVDSLRFLCGGESTGVINETDKLKYVRKYWDALKKKYPEAFDSTSYKDYIILKGAGFGALNTLLPFFILSSKKTGVSIEDYVEQLREANPLKSWHKREIHGRWSSRQSDLRKNALELLDSMGLSFTYLNYTLFDTIEKIKGIKKSIFRDARYLLTPFNLQDIASLNAENVTPYGCYVLVKVNKNSTRVYVGQSVDIKTRLSQHKKKYQLYAGKSCKDNVEMKLLESYTYHLIPPELRDNKIHPPGKDICDICPHLS